MSHYNFRLNGRNFFLTYPKTLISKEIVLEQLNTKFPNQIKGYFIVREMHRSELEEAPTPHIHAIVCFNIKKNIKDSTFFDLTFLNKKVHGSYETIKSLPKALRYLEKEDMIPLKNLKGNHTAIVFDDFKWSKLDVSEKISLFEKKSNRDIKILYESINISKNLIKIVLTNSLSSVFCTETYSLSRRTFIIELEKPLIKEKNG